MFIAHIEHHHITKNVPESALIKRIGRAFAEAGVGSIPVRIFCDDSECSMLNNDGFMYFDNNHLTENGSKKLVQHILSYLKI